MDQSKTKSSEASVSAESRALVLSSAGSKGVATLPLPSDAASMWQIMECLFDQVQTLQQNQAMHHAGVHDRLDAVELQLPLIQEQSALRIHDIETRLTSEVEQATRSAVEDATTGLQKTYEGRFGSLTELVESQRKELAQLRESRQLADLRLNRAIVDIERLCSEVTPDRDAHRTPAASTPTEDASRAQPVAPRSAFYSSENNRSENAKTAFNKPAPITPGGASEGASPGFDDWKQQFMQEGEPLSPSAPVAAGKYRAIHCPKCLSERTRPATHNRWDAVFNFVGLTPYRCRACAHRFYKNVLPPLVPSHDEPLAGMRIHKQESQPSAKQADVRQGIGARTEQVGTR